MFEPATQEELDRFSAFVRATPVPPWTQRLVLDDVAKMLKVDRRTLDLLTYFIKRELKTWPKPKG